MNIKNHTIIFLVKTLLFSLFLIAAILFLTSLLYHFSDIPFPFINGSLSPDEQASANEWEASKKPVVILDAGHGGMDPGAISVLGDHEKNINLAVVQKLGSFLEAGGITVIYTRTEDVMLTSEKTQSRKMGDLLARVELAKEYPDATFISIHMNTLPIEKYSGLQTFYSDQNDQSRVLAQVIQNDAIRLLQPDNRREAKNAKGNIYILDRMDNKSVLIECGFLSNYAEAEMLTQEDYQLKLAFVLSRSILSFVLENGKI